MYLLLKMEDHKYINGGTSLSLKLNTSNERCNISQPLKLNIINDEKCNVSRPLKLNIINDKKCNVSRPLKLKIIEEKKTDNTQLLQLNITSNNKCNIITPPKSNIPRSLKLIIVNKTDYKDNILLFNSIVEEAKNFLNSVPEMQKMIPPIISYKKIRKYSYDILLNRSREKFGLIFDYSLTNPEDITNLESKITVRCMICTYKQTTRIESHLKSKGCQNCSNKCLWYYEIFIYESFLINGDKFIYPIMELDKKISTSEPFDIVCKKSKHIWSTTINVHVNQKHGCQKCNSDAERWNYDKLMEAVIRVHEYKYNYSKVIPSEIDSWDSRFIVICNTCDYEWSPVLNDHINDKTGCPLCAGNLAWKYERFLITAFKIHGNNIYYGLIKAEDIKNRNSIIKLLCRKCNHYWETNITKHINTGTGCKICSKREPWTYIKFIETAKIIHDNKYSYELFTPDDFKGNKSIINVICTICKYQWPTIINTHIYRKSNCPKCMNHATITLEELINKIIEINGNNIDYSLIKKEHIKNNRSHVPLICNKCKKCWSPSVDSLINQKYGCPRCKISKGERACINYLLANNIAFEEQFKIQELVMKRFDFMIEYNSLNYIIEFDGVQHFKFVEYFHKLPNIFIERQEIDILKTITALKCGYNVIRIDYKQIDNVDFHISEALKLEQKTYF